MKQRAASITAWAGAGCALALVAGGVLITLLGASIERPPGVSSALGQSMLSLSIAVSAVVGGVIASRRPGNRYGWLWIVLALAGAWLSFGSAYAVHGALLDPGSLPAAPAVGLAADYGWLVWVGTEPFLLILFPTGHPPSPRWGWLLKLVAASLVLSLLVAWAHVQRLGIAPIDNPFGIEGPVGDAAGAITAVGVGIVFVSIVAGVGSLVIRYRRGTADERAQIKWLAYAAALLVPTFFYDAPGILDPIAEAVASAALPVAVAIAILKHRLYDIDVVINRTLVYGSLTVALALIYGASVALLQQLLSPFTGEENIAVAASTLAVAGLFRPARSRIQRFIDHRFYRSKYDAGRVVESFSARLRDQVDLDSLSPELLGVIARTMHPAHVSLWLQPSEEPAPRTSS